MHDGIDCYYNFIDLFSKHFDEVNSVLQFRGFCRYYRPMEKMAASRMEIASSRP